MSYSVPAKKDRVTWCRSENHSPSSSRATVSAPADCRPGGTSIGWACQHLLSSSRSSSCLNRHLSALISPAVSPNAGAATRCHLDLRVSSSLSPPSSPRSGLLQAPLGLGLLEDSIQPQRPTPSHHSNGHQGTLGGMFRGLPRAAVHSIVHSDGRKQVIEPAAVEVQLLSLALANNYRGPPPCKPYTIGVDAR